MERSEGNDGDIYSTATDKRWRSVGGIPRSPFGDDCEWTRNKIVWGRVCKICSGLVILSKYFETVIENSDVKLSSNLITGELFALLNEKNLEITQSPISAKNLSKLINLIKDGTISGKIAKTVFEMMAEGDKNPIDIVKEKGLKQQSDPKELEKLIEKVINENQDKVKEYKSGKEKLFGFFVGQAMKVSGGKANPQLVNEILKKKLK